MSEDILCGALASRAEAICTTNFPDFSVRRCLGAGASAAVYEIGNGKILRALKVYDPKFFSGKNRRVEKHRIQLQLGLRGHGRSDLVEIIGADEYEDTAFILMEHIPWNPLSKEIGRVPIASARGLISKLAVAARFLEEKGLTHRDIKPANIMVSSDFSQVKLLDLGVLRALSQDDPPLSDADGELPFVATVQYSSPEYLFRLGEHNEDFWRGLTFYQLGGVLHDLLVGKPLFEKQANTKNRYVLAYAVLFERPQIEVDAEPALLALARNALNKSLEARLHRVSWNDFSEAEATEDALRARLGLGVGRKRVIDRPALEAVRINLERAVCLVRDSLHRKLRAEEYPPPTLEISGTGILQRNLVVEFKALQTEQAAHFLRAAIALRVEDAHQMISISIRTSLASVTAAQEMDGKLVWTCDLLKVETEADAISVMLEREILRAYADAVSAIEQ